ncbi:unnamed protein product [Diatraea saccharalis]|uniref:Peptidase S1 domain-containing protein n=1 Tax=Diatraea saccharalis TaxID=40085 RepID=A0A9N9WE23_9NEOP|nr:unnamed protein product [Diatraea saccharalis]
MVELTTDQKSGSSKGFSCYLLPKYLNFRVELTTKKKSVLSTKTNSKEKIKTRKTLPRPNKKSFVDEDDDEDYEPPQWESETHSNKRRIILRYPIAEMDPPILVALTTSVPPILKRKKSNYTEDEKEKACEYGNEQFPYPEVPQINKTSRRVVDYKCEELMWYVKYRIHDDKVNKEICFADEDISGIVGGKNSSFGDFPHMGALGWLTIDNNYVYFCGTSLISTRFSITAAHCTVLSNRGEYNVKDKEPNIVRFGNTDISDDTDATDMIIKNIINHDKYVLHVKYYDIALIEFTEDIQFSEYIRPACIWHKSIDLTGTAGNVTGWGQTDAESPSSTTSILQYAEIDFIGRNQCKHLLENRLYRLWQYGLVDSQFCAGKLDVRVDTCLGDSGGPIQIWRSFQYDENVLVHYVVGITNFGFDCAKLNSPSIYANVTSYLCWIENNVWPNETNTYCP